MKAPLLLLAILGITGLFGFAQTAPQLAPPPDLPTAIERQKAAREALKSQAGEAQAALQKWYHAALDAVKKDAVTKGDLDAVLTVDKERDRLDRDLTAEEKAGLPKLLQGARNQYDQARAQRAAQQKAAAAASLKEYMGTLEALEKALTQKLDIDGALAVRQERAAANAQLTANASTSTAPAPPAAPSAPAAATPPAGSAPAAESKGKPAPVLQVAAEMRAWKDFVSVTPEAIFFGTPYGPERTRGGRGLLLKNTPTTGRQGSTWSFSITQSAVSHGAEIIHPHGPGQITIFLRPDGLSVINPADFGKQPWVPGDRKRIKLTGAFAEVFPLSDRQKYQVVSRLNAAGDYTMTIDEKLVGTAHFGEGGSITLTSGYAADNLPMKWSAGYASILVGPAEHGSNVLQDVTFQASAP